MAYEIGTKYALTNLKWKMLICLLFPFMHALFLTTPTPSLVDPWTTLWPCVSHTMEMKGCVRAPEILICESALKVKIEQSYGIWNRHKVCPNDNFKKEQLNLSTFSFDCVLLPSDYILRSVADRWRPWFWVSAAHLGRRDDTPSQLFQHFLLGKER